MMPLRGCLSVLLAEPCGRPGWRPCIRPIASAVNLAASPISIDAGGEVIDQPLLVFAGWQPVVELVDDFGQWWQRARAELGGHVLKPCAEFPLRAVPTAAGAGEVALLQLGVAEDEVVAGLHLLLLGQLGADRAIPDAVRLLLHPCLGEQDAEAS